MKRKALIFRKDNPTLIQIDKPSNIIEVNTLLGTNYTTIYTFRIGRKKYDLYIDGRKSKTTTLFIDEKEYQGNFLISKAIGGVNYGLSEEDLELLKRTAVVIQYIDESGELKNAVEIQTKRSKS